MFISVDRLSWSLFISTVIYNMQVRKLHHGLEHTDSWWTSKHKSCLLYKTFFFYPLFLLLTANNINLIKNRLSCNWKIDLALKTHIRVLLLPSVMFSSWLALQSCRPFPCWSEDNHQEIQAHMVFSVAISEQAGHSTHPSPYTFSLKI